MTNLGDAAYRALLLALPADVRRDCGDDMTQMFRDYRREARGRPLRLIALWCAAIGDVASSVAAERRPRPGRLSSMRSVMRGLASDFRHGLRLLRRYRATSLLAIVTLALGIGGNAAIFSVVDAVLLRTLPYEQPDKIVMVWEKRPREGVATNVVAPADYLDWRRMNSSFEQMSAVIPTALSLTGDGEPVQLQGGVVGAEFFELLRVKPAMGRTFQRADEVFGQHRVAVLTDGLWTRRYGSDKTIVGRTITMNGNPWTVIGVLPPEFTFIDHDIELWAPLVLETPTAPAPRASHQLEVYGRLKPAVTLAQARTEMDAIGAELEKAYPEENKGHGANVVPIKEQYVGPVKTSLIVLFAAVGFVLLIACVNVASLLLSRALARGREMAVRSALGANRRRLIVQSLVESVTLAMAGGAAGIGVAYVTLKALPLVMPERLSMVGINDVSLDLRALGFMAALSMATGVLFGVLPAIQASRVGIASALGPGGRSAAGIRRRARLALVVAEVALATLTLMGAGLAIRSFTSIMSQPLGFESHGRLTLSVSLPRARYQTPEQRSAAMDQIEQRFRSLPGVTAIGAIDILPMSGDDSRSGVTIEGREPTPDSPTRMHPRNVTPSYFGTMGIQIVKGRGFAPEDVGGPPVTVISQTAASRFWPNRDPIGTRVRFNGEETWRTVVGISADVRHWGMTRPINPMWYMPQNGAGALTFVIATPADPASLLASARAEIAAIDKNLPIRGVATLDELVARSVRAERAQTVLMGTFGALGLLLAVLGIYGVMAQLAVARTHEIGLRMALGARPAHVLGQVLREGMTQSIVGLAIGLGAGIYLGRYAATLFVGIKPSDITTIAGVSVVLVTAAAIACFIPARRAMRIDPVIALRN